MSYLEKDMLMNRLAAEAKLGRISRRSFMSTAMAAGMTATAATGLWTTSAKAQPKRGGTWRLAQHDGNSSDTHDPGTYVTFGMINLAHIYRSYLTQINPDQTLGGDLATEWSATPDATEWTFKLNSSATFHSGGKVTANDVIASINHHRGEGNTSAAAALLVGVQDLVDNGDGSITFKLGAPNADLPWLLTDYHIAICPANADGTINWQSGDGSGPYKLVENAFGVSSSLVRHDG